MFDPTKIRAIDLSKIDDFTKSQFDLATVAGKDAIAEQIEKDIDEYCKLAYDDGPRSHLGASVIGHDCDFYLWASFRWMKFENFNGRMQRLFNRGHKMEDRFIEWLTGLGFEVQQTDVDGKQIRFAAVEKHFGGSCDGNTFIPTRYGVYPDKILLEFKTANDKRFNETKNLGVVKANPRHFSQACTYGVKLDIHYVLYICINKNNDELDIELIELDWELGQKEIARAEEIIRSEVPPFRIIGHNASSFKCKYCCMNGVCHLREPLERNCRSCAAAVPIADGKWFCRMWNNEIPKDFIPVGCEAYTELRR